MIEVPEDSTFSLFDIADVQYQLERLITQKVDIVMKNAVKENIMKRIGPDLKMIYER
jgi:predicted nucleotidyltransferase